MQFLQDSSDVAGGFSGNDVGSRILNQVAIIETGCDNDGCAIRREKWMQVEMLQR